MACPGNVGALIKAFMETTKELTNDQILAISGGTQKEWDAYLAGPKVQSLVRCANLQLAMENYEIISSGINSLRWRRVRCAEARISQATEQLKKASNHLHNAEENLWAIARDERAPKRLRGDALAWLELYSNDRNTKNRIVFEEWSIELQKALPFREIGKK